MSLEQNRSPDLEPVGERESHNEPETIDYVREALCGLTVAIALVPEAIGFSFIAGVNPRTGLQTAWIMCLVAGVFTGQPGMITSCTGAISICLTDFISKYGEGHVVVPVILCGMFQILFGVFGIGKLFLHYASQPVMYGFCNGLAILICMAQLSLFENGREEDGDEKPFITGIKLMSTLILISFTMAVIYLTPKVVQKVMPICLLAIGLTTMVEHLLYRMVLGTETCLIQDFANVETGWPVPFWYEWDKYFDASNLGVYATLALQLCCVGLVETMLTLKLIDEMLEVEGLPNFECGAQGLANMVTGFLGGIGGDAMIGQSIINIQSGARSRFSSILAAIALFIMTISLPSILEKIPISALIGVMFTVVINTFEWRTFTMLLYFILPTTWFSYFFPDTALTNTLSDLVIILTVSIATIIFDLSVAVGIGMFMSCALYVWSVHEPEYEVEDVSNMLRVYRFKAPVFFGNAGKFLEIFVPANDPETIIIVFPGGGEIRDMTAIHVFETLKKRYLNHGKNVQIDVRNTPTIELVQLANENLTPPQEQNLTDKMNPICHAN